MAPRKYSMIGHEPRSMAGRPSTYHPAICERILEMAKQGMFPEEWVYELGTSLPSLYRWANMYPELDESITQAWGILRAFYARWLRDRVIDPATRPVLALLMLTKRFPEVYAKDAIGVTQQHYETRDRTQVEGDTIEGTLATPAPSPQQINAMGEGELQEQIEALQRRLAARQG